MQCIYQSQKLIIKKANLQNKFQINLLRHLFNQKHPIAIKMINGQDYQT